MALRLPSVSDTDRLPMRGLPRRTSAQTATVMVDLVHVAPLRLSAAAASAPPNWNALPLRCRNLCGMVGVALPLRNKQKSGTQPSITSQGPTYRISVGNSSNSLVEAWSMGPMAARGRQLELLKGAEKRQMGLNVMGGTHPGVIVGCLPFRGRNRHLKNS